MFRLYSQDDWATPSLGRGLGLLNQIGYSYIKISSKSSVLVVSARILLYRYKDQHILQNLLCLYIAMQLQLEQATDFRPPDISGRYIFCMNNEP